MALIPTSARTDSCIFAAGGKGDRAAPLMRRLADERSRVSVHGLTGIRWASAGPLEAQKTFRRLKA